MKSNRRYDIDWLRNLGILLLFPFHSARVFDYWDPFYVKSHELSWDPVHKMDIWGENQNSNNIRESNNKHE